MFAGPSCYAFAAPAVAPLRRISGRLSRCRLGEQERILVTQVVDGNWGIHAVVKKAIFASTETV
jgi:hypothetical protein